MNVTLIVRESGTAPIVEAPPFQKWILPDSRVWALFFRIGPDFLVRFPGFADFCVTAEGSNVIAWPSPGLPEATFSHLYYNQVLPLAMSAQRELIFHASAVEIDEKAVGFLGMSGMGKSTLAASFAQAGKRFLTDDALATVQTDDGFEVLPGQPSIRLWSDSQAAVIKHQPQIGPSVHFTTKARLLADEAIVYCDEPRSLDRIYVLGEDIESGFRLERLSSRETMLKLVSHSFVLDTNTPEVLSQHFDHLSQLVRQVTCYQLDYPRNFASLPEVREVIIRQSTLSTVFESSGSANRSQLLSEQS